MASETDHVLAHSQEVEKKVDSEVKKVEAEVVPVSKQGLENPEAEESLCLDESGAKTEEKQVEPTVVEEVKAVDVDEKPKAGDKAEPKVDTVDNKPEAVEPVVVEEQTKTEAAPLAEPSGDKIDDKLVESLAAEKIEDKPVAAKPVVVDKPKKCDAAPLAEPTGDKIKDKLVEPSTAEKIEDKLVAVECVVVEEPTKTEAAQLAEPTGDKAEDKLVEPSAAEKIEDKPVPVEPVVVKEPTKADVALLAEHTGDKIEDKLVEPLAEDKAVEPPLAVEQKKSEAVELIEKKTEDKAVEHPAEEEEKTESAPDVECSDKGVQELVKEAVIEPDTVSISGSTVEKADSKVEEKSKPEEQAENQVEETKPEPIEEKFLDSERCSVPESSPAKEAVEEKADEVPAKGVEVIEAKEAPALVDECKPAAVEQIAKDPPESAPVEKDESQYVVGEVKIAKEEEANAAKSLDQVKSEIPLELKKVECYQEEVPGKNVGSKVEKPAEVAAEVKVPSVEKVLELEKADEKTEERSPAAEEFVMCEERKPTEDAATTSTPLPEPVEKAAVEVTCREIEPPVENGKSKDQAVTSAETTEEAVVVKNADAVASKELEETEAAERKEEAVQAAEASLEEEKQVDKIMEERVQTEAKAEETKEPDEPGKTDVQNSECAKDTEDTKTALKEDVPVKTQKTSIVKMMKQSLVKAKKAIIGKSHNSKAVASELKDDCSK